jgi:ubiquinone/menaquinone biosynthesis C-methylase UbiE
MLTKFEIENIEKVRSYYTKNNLSELQMTNLLTVGQYAHVYSVTMEYLKPFDRVLDWSCGSGHYSLFLLLQNADVTSIGFNSPSYIRQLLPKKINYVEGNLNEPVRLPFNPGEFKMVFSIGVLEHVPETGGSELQSLREVHRILQPGGIFFICHLPNYGSWIEYLVRTFFSDRFHHKFLYRRKDIEELAQKSGFIVLKLERYGIFPKNSFSRVSSLFGNSKTALQVFYLLEAACSFAFRPFCQNWLVVLKRLDA